MRSCAPRRCVWSPAKRVPSWVARAHVHASVSGGGSACRLYGHEGKDYGIESRVSLAQARLAVPDDGDRRDRSHRVQHPGNRGGQRLDAEFAPRWASRRAEPRRRRGRTTFGERAGGKHIPMRRVRRRRNCTRDRARRLSRERIVVCSTPATRARARCNLVIPDKRVPPGRTRRLRRFGACIDAARIGL